MFALREFVNNELETFSKRASGSGGHTGNRFFKLTLKESFALFQFARAGLCKGKDVCPTITGIGGAFEETMTRQNIAVPAHGRFGEREVGGDILLIYLVTAINRGQDQKLGEGNAAFLGQDAIANFIT